MKIELKGTLSYEQNPVSNQPIYLSYSMGASSWVYLTSVQTDSGGNFAFNWNPTSSGNYQVRAETKATTSMGGAAKTINLLITLPRPEKPSENLFAVNSNSTVEQLSFNSNTNVLTFTVDGTLGTTGFVDFYFPKTELDSLSMLKVNGDGVEVPFEHKSLGEVWQISFTYSHNIHTITIKLDDSSDFITIENGRLCVNFIATWLMIMVATMAIALPLKPR
jgi:hypothetical protein